MFFYPESGFFPGGTVRPLIWKASAILLMAVILFWGCATTDSGDSPEEKSGLAQKKFREALRLGSLSQKSEATQALKEAAASGPDNDASFHFYLGKIYWADGDIDKAEAEFLKSVRLNDRLKDSYLQLARIYMQKKRMEKSCPLL